MVISILQKPKDKEVAGGCGGAGFCTQSLVALYSVVLPWTLFLLLTALRELGLRQDSRNWHHNTKACLSKLRNVIVGKML